MNLKFDGWPWKTIGHLFYATSSFVHHFGAIDELKLELQSGNAQFGSKSTIFLAVWPWNLTDDFQQGKSEGFDSCDQPSNLTQIGLKSSIFHPCDLEIWWMTPNKANLRDLIAATGLVILLKLGSNGRFFSPCDLEISWMTLKNYRAPLLQYIKLCASSQTHWWIKTGVIVRKRSIWVKISDLLSHVTFKFDGWP